MIYRIEDLEKEESVYIPLRYDVMSKLHADYNSTVTLTAILLVGRWIENNKANIDFDRAALVASTKNGRDFSDNRKEIEEAYNIILESIKELQKHSKHGKQ